MHQLLDIKSDYIFKQVFGQEKNKDILISLLNAILQGKPVIKNVELRNTDIAKIIQDNRSIRLDVKAELPDRTFVDIEIQCKNTGDIPERAVQYLAGLMVENAKPSEDYKDPKVIGIWILGENVTDRKAAINEACMTFQPNDYEPGFKLMTNKARIIFVELPKFHPKDPNRRDCLDAWLAFLKDPIDGVDYSTIPEIKKALSVLKYISLDPDTRSIYDLREKTIKDANSEKSVALERAWSKGKSEGLAEGKLSIARNMLSMGLPFEQIVQLTGLSLSEVEHLKST